MGNLCFVASLRNNTTLNAEACSNGEKTEKLYKWIHAFWIIKDFLILQMRLPVFRELIRTNKHCNSSEKWHNKNSQPTKIILNYILFHEKSLLNSTLLNY
jgi:hypothetical protein